VRLNRDLIQLAGQLSEKLLMHKLDLLHQPDPASWHSREAEH